MASEVRSGLPAAQSKAKESQEALVEAQRRIDDLDAQIEAVKDRIRGIDGGSLQQLGKDLKRARQDADEARRQRHDIAERFERVEGKMPADERTWDLKRAALAESADTYDDWARRRKNTGNWWGSCMTGSASATRSDGITGANSTIGRASATKWTRHVR